MKPEHEARWTRKERNRKERRARKVTDHLRTGFVSAVGADEAAVWCDGTAGWRKPLSGQHSDGESQ